ncbi:MAG: 5'/3'-nucleotidase SurE [Bacteroidaceae bacterium]|nr:5'/3'-nucleotidase SurE [Bacteroidaceae bacterium]
MKPLILISNDDGIQAQGIQELIKMLRPLGDLFVVAPDQARSGAAGSITSPLPITINTVTLENGLTVYACTGTPTDCVKLALDQLLVRRPNLVVAGINHGSNASINLHYSGTVGAAREGALHGIPSIAFSLCSEEVNEGDFIPMEEYVVHICQSILQEDIPFGTLLNVNFPPTSEYNGIRVCRMGYSAWENEFTATERPRGGRYYWLGGDHVDEEPEATDTDLNALQEGYIAVTPLKIDETDYELKQLMESWDL